MSGGAIFRAVCGDNRRKEGLSPKHTSKKGGTGGYDAENAQLALRSELEVAERDSRSTRGFNSSRRPARARSAACRPRGVIAASRRRPRALIPFLIYRHHRPFLLSSLHAAAFLLILCDLPRPYHHLFLRSTQCAHQREGSYPKCLISSIT
jgi:hypothetical protein